MSYESEMRRQMEQKAAEQSQCPVDGEVDAAFSLRKEKKALKKSMGLKGRPKPGEPVIRGFKKSVK